MGLFSKSFYRNLLVLILIGLSLTPVFWFSVSIKLVFASTPSPTPTANIYIEHTYIGDLILTIGVGNDTANPIWSEVVWNRTGGNQDNMLLTVNLTGKEEYLPPSETQPYDHLWFLTVYDAVERDQGQVVWFNITYQDRTYVSNDVSRKIMDFHNTTVYNPLSPFVLMLKWKVNPGNTITTIGPLAADLIPNRPGLEIVVTGGNSLNDTKKDTSHGDITVLDGTTGEVIWKRSGYPIGIHQPFEIADLNKDSIPEIIISAWNSTLVLHGNNGSEYWRTYVPADDLWPAVADIDGDGYPTIFVSGGNAPWQDPDGDGQGEDYITSLSYNGTILHQTESWNPCYGGLTVGDTNFDGRFELYQGDRSYDYNPPGPPYSGGGWGVRAVDAYTLTPLWNDADILASSHTVMLADVDKDGVLDAIAGDEGHIHGPVVLNTTDGSVLTTGGIYRKGADGIWVHSQPTVYDIDQDGNLEFITAKYSAPMIFDLYEWKLDERLNNVNCAEPPKVGDVTGDGKMDIIAVNGTDIYIYVYNQTGSKYQEVWHETGLDGARAFTLVQDVDSDGYNELVVTSTSGNIYCYDTPALASTPRVRSELSFYSERRLGVADYVPPFLTFQSPILSNPSPLDEATNVSVDISELKFTLRDYQNDRMNYTVTTSPNIIVGSGTGINVTNGIYSVQVAGLNHSVKYTWHVNVTDTHGHWTNKTFTFVTRGSGVYAVQFQSEEDSSTSSNLGSITFDSRNYRLPNEAYAVDGIYVAEYFADSNYIFDHWATNDGVTVSNSTENPTTVIVSGDGTLKAVYSIRPRAHIYIEHTWVGDLVVTIGVHNENLVWSEVVWNREGGSQRDLDLLIDVSDAVAYLPPSDTYRWYLQVYDAANRDQGNITQFTITYQGITYNSTDVPVPINDLQTSFAYIPTLPPPIATAHIYIEHTYRGDLNVTVGVGDPESPLWSQVVWGREGGSQDNLDLLIDVSDAVAYLPPSDTYRWYLQVYDAANRDQGRIVSFNITYQDILYSSADTPVPINDLQTSYSHIPSVNASAYIFIEHTYRGDLIVDVGVGELNSPLWIVNVWNGQGAGEDDLNLTIDLSSAAPYLPPSGTYTWWVKVYDRYNADQGQIVEFTITYQGETYSSADVPVPIRDLQTSYAYIKK